MAKKFVIGMVMITLMLLSGIVAQAENMALRFVSSEQFSSNQGQDGWYYQIKAAGEYQNMYFDAAKNQWTADNTGGVYIGKESIHPGNKIDTARVWEADMAGIVRLEPQGNVRKSGLGGPGITLRIIKNDELIWTDFLGGTDNIGFSYRLETEVSCGDRLYFEVSAESVSYGATTWIPRVTYVQTVTYSADSARIKSFSELKQGNTLTCSFYDTLSVDESAVAYIAIYDLEGRLRKISEPNYFNFELQEEPYTDTSVFLDVSAENYEGWSAKLIVLTAESGRYYPMELSRVLCLDSDMFKERKVLRIEKS